MIELPNKNKIDVFLHHIGDSAEYGWYCLCQYNHNFSPVILIYSILRKTVISLILSGLPEM